MHKPIYSSEEHKAILELYINMCKEFAKDVSTISKYNSFLDIVDTIIEYHNNYGKGMREEGNFYDWIMIIPTNLSVATNGFFAGLETKRNAATIRSYKVILEQLLYETAEKIDKIEPTND
tara:strand:+ start:77 stop:436 length:360 start_codon:yes stop_codon:yes gene_type:complete